MKSTQSGDSKKNPCAIYALSSSPKTRKEYKNKKSRRNYTLLNIRVFPFLQYCRHTKASWQRAANNAHRYFLNDTQIYSKNIECSMKIDYCSSRVLHTCAFLLASSLRLYTSEDAWFLPVPVYYGWTEALFILLLYTLNNPKILWILGLDVNEDTVFIHLSHQIRSVW